MDGSEKYCYSQAEAAGRLRRASLHPGQAGNRTLVRLGLSVRGIIDLAKELLDQHKKARYNHIFISVTTGHSLGLSLC